MRKLILMANSSDEDDYEGPPPGWEHVTPSKTHCLREERLMEIKNGPDEGPLSASQSVSPAHSLNFKREEQIQSNNKVDVDPLPDWQPNLLSPTQNVKKQLAMNVMDEDSSSRSQSVLPSPAEKQPILPSHAQNLQNEQRIESKVTVHDGVLPGGQSISSSHARNLEQGQIMETMKAVVELHFPIPSSQGQGLEEGQIMEVEDVVIEGLMPPSSSDKEPPPEWKSTPFPAQSLEENNRMDIEVDADKGPPPGSQNLKNKQKMDIELAQDAPPGWQSNTSSPANKIKDPQEIESSLIDDSVRHPTSPAPAQSSEKLQIMDMKHFDEVGPSLQCLAPSPSPPLQCLHPSQEMGQMVCGVCRSLLSYPKGNRHIRCAGCQSVNLVLEAHQVGTVTCCSCSILLMYPFGAPAVKCSRCHGVMEIGEHNRRPPLSVQQAQGPKSIQ